MKCKLGFHLWSDFPCLTGLGLNYRQRATPPKKNDCSFSSAAAWRPQTSVSSSCLSSEQLGSEKTNPQAWVFHIHGTRSLPRKKQKQHTRQSHTIHVWYADLHLLDFYGKLVGKYTIHGLFGNNGILKLSNLLGNTNLSTTCGDFSPAIDSNISLTNIN